MSKPIGLDDDAVAWITIRLHANGTLSTAGHIQNKRLALQLLDHARDAIRGQVPDDDAITIPNRDVAIVPPSALKEVGDIPADQRGDP